MDVLLVIDSHVRLPAPHQASPLALLVGLTVGVLDRAKGLIKLEARISSVDWVHADRVAARA